MWKKIKDKLAVPGLLEELKKGSSAAAQALGKIKDVGAVPGLRDALLHADGAMLVSCAATALSEIGWQPGSEEEKIRYYLSIDGSFYFQQVRGVRTIQGLLEVLRKGRDTSSDRYTGFRKYIAETLTRIGWHPDSEEEKVVYYFGLEEWDELAKIGVASVHLLLDVLVQTTGHVAYRSSRSAQDALVKIGSAAVPGLLERLKDGSCRVADVLGRIKDPRAVPGLLEALKDKAEDLQVFSAQALGNIKDPRAIPGLLEALQDKKDAVRVSAVQALVKINDVLSAASSAEALSLLLRAMSLVAEPGLTKAVVKFAGAAVPGLLELLKDKKTDARKSAAEALGEIADETAVPGLTTALKDEDGNVRWLAAEALEKIEDAAYIRTLGADTVIPGLLIALRAAQKDAWLKRLDEVELQSGDYLARERTDPGYFRKFSAMEKEMPQYKRVHTSDPVYYRPLYDEYNRISDSLHHLGHSRGDFRYELVLVEKAYSYSDAYDEWTRYCAAKYEWVKVSRNSDESFSRTFVDLKKAKGFPELYERSAGK